MTKNLIFLLVVGAVSFSLIWSCGDDGTDESQDSETPDSDNTSDNSDSEKNPATCDLEAWETFDTVIPTGWKVITAGGSGSGSGSGSGTPDPIEVDESKTWHHTTTTDENDSHKGMEGGYMVVGGFSGMNEELVSASYEVGGCSKVELSFTHYFDDLSRNESDRGEVWFIGDTPPWTKLATYNSNPDKTESSETIDLTAHIAGQEFFQVKFVFADDGGGNYGWAVDNVSVVGSK